MKPETLLLPRGPGPRSYTGVSAQVLDELAEKRYDTDSVFTHQWGPGDDNWTRLILRDAVPRRARHVKDQCERILLTWKAP